MTLDLVSKKNPFLFVVLGDFNSKLSQAHDKDTNISKEISADSITSQLGLHQIINEPTYILENSSSAVVVWTLNQLRTIFFTVLHILLKDVLS